MASVLLSWSYGPAQEAPEGSLPEDHHTVFLGSMEQLAVLGDLSALFTEVEPGEYEFWVRTYDVNEALLHEAQGPNVVIQPGVMFTHIAINLQAQVS